MLSGKVQLSQYTWYKKKKRKKAVFMPSNRVNHSVKPDGLCGLHISHQVEVEEFLQLVSAAETRIVGASNSTNQP